MEPSANNQGNITNFSSGVFVKVALVLVGIALGAGAVGYYFVFMVPKSDQAILETVSETTVTNTTPTTTVPVSVSKFSVPDFRIIQTRNADYSPATMSVGDMNIVQTAADVIRKSTSFPRYYSKDSDVILDFDGFIVANDYAFVLMGIPKGGAGMNAFIVDLKNKKLTQTFYVHRWTYLGPGVFVFFDIKTSSGLWYYVYGASSSQMFAGSELKNPQTYIAWEGGEGSSALGVIATTTDSITLGVFDFTNSKQAPGDDMISPEKVGERTFTIPRP